MITPTTAHVRSLATTENVRLRALDRVTVTRLDPFAPMVRSAVVSWFEALSFGAPERNSFFEGPLLLADGTELYVHMPGSRTTGSPVVTLIHATPQRDAAHALMVRATTDPLAGLANRASFRHPGIDVREMAAACGAALMNLAAPHQLPSGMLRITASAGVAPTRAGSPEIMLARADTALYAAKRAGRGEVRVYGDPDAVPASRRQMAAALQREQAVVDHRVRRHRPLRRVQPHARRLCRRPGTGWGGSGAGRSRPSG